MVWPSINRIEPPELLFWNGGRCRVPIRGIKEHGPYDGPVTINLYVLGFKGTESHIKGLINNLNQYFGEVPTEIVINVVDETFLPRDYIKRSNLQKYSKEAIRIINKWRREKRDHKVLLQVIPRRDDVPDGYYYFVRKVALSKRDGVRALPVQTITMETLRRAGGFRRHRARKGIIHNLAIALYAKVGYRPWILAGTVSEHFTDAIYVGYDISYHREYGSKGMGGVVVFDSRGQVIEYFDVEIQVEEGDKIDRSSFNEFVERIIMSAESRDIRPSVVVFHRDGDYKPHEIELVRECMERWKMNYILLEFSKVNAPIFKYNREKNEWISAESGYWLKMGYEFSRGQKYPTYLLQSYGGEIPLGVYANMLKFRYVDRRVMRRVPNLEEDIVRQVFYLTRLNYATKIGVAKLPITVHYAHKVANIKRVGIILGEFEAGKVNKPLWML